MCAHVCVIYVSICRWMLMLTVIDFHEEAFMAGEKRKNYAILHYFLFFLIRFDVFIFIAMATPSSWVQKPTGGQMLLHFSLWQVNLRKRSATIKGEESGCCS